MTTKKPVKSTESTESTEYDDLHKRLYVSMIAARYAPLAQNAVVVGEMEYLYADAFFDAKLATEIFFHERASGGGQP